MELKEIVEQMKDKDFVGYCTPGCGSLLGLRLLVQSLGKFMLVNSPGCVSINKNSLKMPYANLGFNAAAAASGIARSTNELVVVYSGDGATQMHVSSLIEACNRNDKMLYVCYNNMAYSAIDYLSPERSLIKSVAPYASYAATASVAYAEDFIEKINKAVLLDGVKFIEVLAPCPSVTGFDMSNTVEVARLATECGIWPVFDIEGKKLNMTKRPLRMEPVSRFYSAIKIHLKDDEMQRLQDKTNKNWKSLSEGKLL